MKYAELKNKSGSCLIDDTYINYRLSWTQSMRINNNTSGVHIERNENGERICTLPYLDYANGRTYAWPTTDPWPDINLLDHAAPPNKFMAFRPIYYIGTPFIRSVCTEGYGHGCARPMLWLKFGPEGFMHAENTGLVLPHMFAIASAMPNIVYTFTQYADRIDHNLDRGFPFQYFINLWQRAESVTLPIYQDSIFSGQNVGYTELERVQPYTTGQGIPPSLFKTKDNEKFKHWSFEQEAKLATMIYAFGIEDEKIVRDRGEMIVKNDRGEALFNSRYDYMRILKYLPEINTLAIHGKNLYNSPQRFSFPGRKIAVVALHPYCCITSSPPGRGDNFIFNTGFWFPDPSTVEFTTCATLNGQLFNHEAYRTPQPSIVRMAELINVMILDVTGCTRGWRLEMISGKPTVEVY